MTRSRRMDEKWSHVSERILNLTLEIVYLLTGESFPPVTSGDQVTIKVPPLHFMTPQKLNMQKILEVTKKINDLLTGEVPIRCQDVTVYFSMEEWEKDLHKHVMKENEVLKDFNAVIKEEYNEEDGATKVLIEGHNNVFMMEPPERRPRPRYSQDFAVQTIRHHHQNEHTTNAEVEEKKTDQITVEELVRMVTVKEEDVPTEITTEHGKITETSEGSPDCEGVRPTSLGVNVDIHPGLLSVERASDPSDLKDSSLYSLPPGLHSMEGLLDPFALGESSAHYLCDRDQTLFRCSMDGKSFSMPEINFGKSHACLECGKCFLKKSHLVRHHGTHTGEKPHLCSECGKRFLRKSNLVIHQMVHTGEKPYMCSECGKNFSNKSNLYVHQRSHTGVKLHSCTECGKRYLHKAGLAIHHRIHTGEKPFVCHECGKCYNDKSNLARHQRTHTGEKPFVCSECGKCFLYNAELTIHFRSHTGERPYSCPECEKRFVCTSDLGRHQKTHRGVKPYSCSECRKCFARKSGLDKHRRSHMRKKP